ncbi:hypothetical protein MALG_01523 [Marinovum algicola DG 898]|nr:hypothetical protein MALG_01523 [Marinovum algicola DG 898]
MKEAAFVAPSAPAGTWEQLSANKKAWIEFIRIISNGTDPCITTGRVQALRNLLDLN